MELMFVCIFVKQCEEGNWATESRSVEALRIARAEINEAFGTSFKLIDMLVRLRKLKHRYFLFRSLVESRDVVYNDTSNAILAPMSWWAAKIQETRYAQVYYHEGEPHYKSMATLFATTRYYLVPPEVLII